MSRKTYTFIIILVLIIIGFGAWWFFSRENSVQTGSTSSPQANQNLFPYGQNTVTTPVSVASSSNQGTVVVGGNSSASAATLVHITTAPVSGYIFLSEGKNSSTSTIRYIDRATGHIYDYYFDTGVTTGVTNTTVTKVYQGSFAASGSRVYLQTIDENNQIETLSASLPPTATTSPVALAAVSLLPKNIISFATNGASLFYIVPSANGSVGYKGNLDGSKSSQVMSSGLSELVAKWQSPTITLATKPNAGVGGYLFDLNTKTGNLSSVLRNITALTTLENPAGSFVFGSNLNNGTTESFIYNEKTGAARVVSVTTLADKCVWSNMSENIIYCAVPASISGNLPDDWYQGNVFLSGNNIWKIAADTGVTNIVDFLSNRNQNIDATNLVLDKNENWVAFMNKEDLTLWALRVSSPGGQQ